MTREYRNCISEDKRTKATYFIINIKFVRVYPGEFYRFLEVLRLKLKENCKYDIIVPTSIGVRIVPLGRRSIATSSLYEMYSTSAETNVLNIPSSLGMNAMAMTKFVKDSPIAAFINNVNRLSKKLNNSIFY